MLQGKVSKFFQAGISRQRVDIGSIQVIDPFDAVQPGLGSQFELIRPPFTRETLDSIFGRGNQATLHDADICHSFSVYSAAEFSRYISL